jgi:transcriptional regulator with XRE-family HTH domain
MGVRVEEIIGKRVRQAREEAGLSQRAFGEQVKGILGSAWTPQAVSQAENGKRDWRARDLVAMCHILRRPVEWFYTPMEEDRWEILDGFADGALIHAEWTSGEEWQRHGMQEAEQELLEIHRAVEDLRARLETAEKAVGAAEEVAEDRQAERGRP